MFRLIVFIVAVFAFLLLSCKEEQMHDIQKKVIIGYVPGFRGELDEKTIDARKLTHINYAFIDVRDSMAWLTNMKTDTINFRRLVTLKGDNPDLKILISLGGWSWSENFSDAVLTESSRRKFARTCVQIVKKYHLDGVDIDWEYPGQKGEDNIFRTVDKQNYTLMFKAIREELNHLANANGKTFLLTTAVGASSEYIDHTEMSEAQKYLDYVNLMTYDFYTSGTMAGHHTNLFPPEDYEIDGSADKAFKEFLKAGVPAEKLVMGIAFYGRSWFMKSDDNKGINRPVDSVARGGGYSYIKDSLFEKQDFVRYWDDNAKAPYLFNHKTNQLVSFDDEESVMHKCKYVIEHGMAGIMFWQYASDPKEYLLDEINRNLYNGADVPSQ